LYEASNTINYAHLRSVGISSARTWSMTIATLPS